MKQDGEAFPVRKPEDRVQKLLFLHPKLDMEQETRQKIQEIVKDILIKADMEEITEFKVRVTASERLRIDLSDLSHKKFIRDLIESFLLSTEEPPNPKPGDRLICKLADMTDVVVHELGGKTHVSVRDFFVKNS